MNLIEQLGGYERASAIANCKSGVVHPTQQLLDALLEHRRQHNFYEVGDLVVSTLNGDDFWVNCVCRIEAFHKKMAITSSGSHAIHHYDFRHATPEEIKAGHRL